MVLIRNEKSGRFLQEKGKEKKKKKAILFLEEIKSQIRFSTQKCVTNATVSKILALLGRKNKISQIKSKAIHRLNYHLVVFYFTIVYNQR